ncbi:MAG: hypothetical protein WAT81_01735 [Candidatus Moraniibacteriota bacterium]
MAHSPSVSGKRVSRSHSTATGLATRVVRMLEKSGLITKVSKLIVSFDQHGLRLVAQEPSGRQDLYVSAPDRDALVAHLEAWCHETRLDCTVRR